MTKKSHITIARVSMLIIVGLAVFAPMAHAQVGDAIGTIFGLSFGGLFSEMASWIANTTMWIMSWWVAITGMLLNVSITITLHIKDFVDNTQGVYTVWQTIRDISGIFIIFMLLYASFLLILDQTSKTLGSVGNLIKNIVIGGILINFSFFITSVLIDASNIVSLALYNGIVSKPAVITNDNLNASAIVSAMIGNSDGGLSAVMMDKLSIQTVYNPSNNNLGGITATVGAPLKILIQGIVGSVIMFMTGMSFFMASLAFVARLIILIFLLAFSPLWFASWIFPVLKDRTKQFTDLLYAQLVFMPVYLLLLYAGMSILSKTSVFNNTTSLWQGSLTQTQSFFLPTNLIIMAINYLFIIFILNLPLVVAFGFVTKEGGGLSWMKGMVDKVSAHNVWKNVGGFAGRNTIGHIAYNADEALAKTIPGNWALGRDLRFATTGALAKAKMGGDRSYEDVRTIHADVVRRAAANKRLKELKAMIARGETNSAEYHRIIDPMPLAERLELPPEIWQDRRVIRQMDDSDYKAFQSSKRVEDTDVVKNAVKQNRRDALQESVSEGSETDIKHALEEFNGHELMKQANRVKVDFNSRDKDGNPMPILKDGNEQPIFKDEIFIKHLKPAHLRSMAEEENLDSDKKGDIGGVIYKWADTHDGHKHPAYGFITREDNREEWLSKVPREEWPQGKKSQQGGSQGSTIIEGSKYGPARGR